MNAEVPVIEERPVRYVNESEIPQEVVIWVKAFNQLKKHRMRFL